jgi:hypothetical protein
MLFICVKDVLLLFSSSDNDSFVQSIWFWRAYNLIIRWYAGGCQNAFFWRVLMLAAVGAGGALLFYALVAAAGSFF